MLFQKGHKPWNKGKKEVSNTGRTHFKKGSTPWNKGIKKATNTGKTWFKKGQTSIFKGKKHTKEAKRKIGEKGKGRISCRKGKSFEAIKGDKNPAKRIEVRKKLSEMFKGNKGSNWKGGITPDNLKIRKSIEMSLWRESVFARDNWTCQKYGSRGCKLHPHHIKNFAEYPELRFAIDNGITFSKKAHNEFHKIYGKKNNTKEQIEEFLNL